MAVQTDTITVGTSATKLTTAAGGDGSILNFTTHVSAVVAVGGPAVTFGTGRPLKVDTEYVFDSAEGHLYAVVAAGSVDIDVLHTGTSTT